MDEVNAPTAIFCPHCDASLEPPPAPHARWCLVGELFARLGAKDLEVERLREALAAEREEWVWVNDEAERLRAAIAEHRESYPPYAGAPEKRLWSVLSSGGNR